MADSVDSYVADNSKRLRDINGRFVQVDSNRTRDLTFGSNFFAVDVAVEVYKRSTGDGMIFGHPSASKGFDNATFGDDRGPWSLVTDAEASADFTKDGRRAAAQALSGREGAAAEVGLGYGTARVSTDDTTLNSARARTASVNDRTSNTTSVRGIFDATASVGALGEFGVFDETSRLLARVTVDVDDASIDPTDEVRGIILLTFTGSGNGNSVVTNDGQIALAEAIERTDATVGPDEFAFGSGTSDFVESDSSLTSEVIRSNAARETGRDRITARTRLTAKDMSTVTSDLSEVGLFDTAGRMLWATTFRTIPSDSEPFNTDTTIVVS